MGNATLGVALRRAALYTAALNAAQGSSNTLIGQYKADTNKYPSNTQVWHAGKDASDNFSPATLDKIGFGNTPAPKGHFILKAFERERSAVSGITSSTFVALDEYDDTRPSCVTSAFGRVFYSGTEDAETQGLLYFTAVINDIGDLERCYQKNDPTSETISDLLADDGGVIKILDCGKIISLVEFNRGVLALSRNGVWFIRSGDDSFFKANNYLIDKVTEVGCLGRDSVIKADDKIFYWSEQGIYVISPTQVGDLSSTSLSHTTIQTEYNSIPVTSKSRAKGVYLGREKKIVWGYNPTGDDLSNLSKFLIFDLQLGAFFVDELAAPTGTYKPKVVSLFQKGFFGSFVESLNVIDSSNNNVKTTTGDNVIINRTVDQSTDQSLKFVSVFQETSIPAIFFCEFKNTEFKDWVVSGTSFTANYFQSYAETNNIVMGELMRNKQAHYLFTYFNRTETGFTTNVDGNLEYVNPSGCKVQFKWSWDETGATGRWSPLQQAYKLSKLYIPSGIGDSFDYGYSVTSSKLLMRGKGKSLKVRFESEDGKDFQLLGWAMPVTVEQTP